MSKVPNLEVSPEEERFLRAAFRRFALPYMVAAALVAGAGGWLAAGGASEPMADLEELRDRVAELAERVEAARLELAAASDRVAGLEARTRQTGEGDVVSLRGEIRSARNRISDLEQRIEREAIPSRLSAVGERVERLERRLDTVASSTRRTAPPPASAPAPLRVE